MQRKIDEMPYLNGVYITVYKKCKYLQCASSWIYGTDVLEIKNGST